jgi:hypothetical protein
VTLTGSGLTGTTGIVVSGAGVTVSGVTVVSDTSVTATFTIATGAGLTARNVHTTNSGGAISNNVAFYGNTVNATCTGRTSAKMSGRCEQKGPRWT